MNPLDIQRVALWWGPGILVLIVFSLGFFRLAQYWIEKSMEVKRQQLDGAYGLVRRYIEQFLGVRAGRPTRSRASPTRSSIASPKRASSTRKCLSP